MTTRQLTIVEGPDGSGKSTFAERLAKDTNALLVHSGPYLRVKKNLARLYVEAMLPALQGYQNVVLDRAWMSEPIYGLAKRKGEDRLGAVNRRMLDRIAARCTTKFVLCLPPVDVCIKPYTDRLAKNQEYLESIDQFHTVYREYLERYEDGSLTSLPTTFYDYTEKKGRSYVSTDAHPLGSHSTGWLDAPVVLVGDNYEEVKEVDTLFRAPFVSFDVNGCAAWLTEQLEEVKVPERKLLWVNINNEQSSNVFQLILRHRRKLVVTLGQTAKKRIEYFMTRCKARNKPGRVISVNNLQHEKRFNPYGKYELVDILREVLA